MSMVPWGAERTGTSVLTMVPIPRAPNRPLPEGHRELWTGQGNDRVRWELQREEVRTEGTRETE